MGGSPRSNMKPRPSYEDGELRDPAIDQDESFGRGKLRELIAKATRASKQVEHR